MTKIIDNLYQVGTAGGELTKEIKKVQPFAVFNNAFELEGNKAPKGVTIYQFHAWGDNDFLPPLAELIEVVRTAVDCLIENRPVIIHCGMGWNRSGIATALVIREMMQCTGAEAVRILQAQRKSALCNHFFEEFVRSLPVPGDNTLEEEYAEYAPTQRQAMPRSTAAALRQPIYLKGQWYE